MQNFLKKSSLVFIWLISLMPFRLLYPFSRFLAFLLYRLIRYRKKVVFSNLRNAFPEKQDKEIKKIAREFYRNFADLILEVLKIRSISKRSLLKRVSFRNFELIEELHSQKKSIIVTIGHCGNWEWMSMLLEMMSGYKVFAVVKPLNDAFYDDYLTRLRTRFNKKGGLIPFKSTFREMVRRKNELTMTIIAGDQTPTKDEINYWTTFLNQDTPVFLGIEKIARSLDFPVLFFDIQRKKRGYYEIDISMVSAFPIQTSEYEITEKHVKMLEQKIRRNPDNWLWSHRRWKHKKTETNA